PATRRWRSLHTVAVAFVVTAIAALGVAVLTGAGTPARSAVAPDPCARPVVFLGPAGNAGGTERVFYRTWLWQVMICQSSLLRAQPELHQNVRFRRSSYLGPTGPGGKACLVVAGCTGWRQHWQWEWRLSLPPAPVRHRPGLPRASH